MSVRSLNGLSSSVVNVNTLSGGDAIEILNNNINLDINKQTLSNTTSANDQYIFEDSNGVCKKILYSTLIGSSGSGLTAGDALTITSNVLDLSISKQTAITSSANDDLYVLEDNAGNIKKITKANLLAGFINTNWTLNGSTLSTLSNTSNIVMGASTMNGSEKLRVNGNSEFDGKITINGSNVLEATALTGAFNFNIQNTNTSGTLNLMGVNSAGATNLLTITNNTILPKLNFPSGIWTNGNATNITDTELYYLDGASSNIQTQLNTLSSSVSTNTSNIATNTAQLSTNTSNISTNTNDINSLTGQQTSNTNAINVNTSNISTNTGAISSIQGQQNTNTLAITSLTNQQNTNTSNISGNQTEISNIKTKYDYTGSVSNGKILIGNGSNFSVGDIVSSDNTITITKSAGGIDIIAPSSSSLSAGTGINITGSNINYDIQKETAYTSPASGDTMLLFDTTNSATKKITFSNFNAGLQAQITSNDTDISNLTTQQNTNTTAIATNASGISSNTSSITSLTTQQTTNTNNINTNSTNITNLTSQQNTNTTNIGNLTTQQNTNTSAISSLTTQQNTNTSAISTNTSAIATNTSAISVNTGNITTNATNISNLTTQQSTNTTNIASLTTQQNTNTSAISSLTTQQNTNTSAISTNTGNISSLTSQQSTNTGNIASLTTQQNTNTSAISSLTTQQNTNTSAIATNATAISNIASPASSSNLGTASSSAITLGNNSQTLALNSASMTAISAGKHFFRSNLSTGLGYEVQGYNSGSPAYHSVVQIHNVSSGFPYLSFLLGSGFQTSQLASKNIVIDANGKIDVANLPQTLGGGIGISIDSTPDINIDFTTIATATQVFSNNQFIIYSDSDSLYKNITFQNILNSIDLSPAFNFGTASSFPVNIGHANNQTLTLQGSLINLTGSNTITNRSSVSTGVSFKIDGYNSADSAYYSTLSVDNSSVAGEKPNLKIMDGAGFTNTASKTLTTDANGKLLWATPSSGGIPQSYTTSVGVDYPMLLLGDLAVNTLTFNGSAPNSSAIFAMSKNATFNGSFNQNFLWMGDAPNRTINMGDFNTSIVIGRSAFTQQLDQTSDRIVSCVAIGHTVGQYSGSNEEAVLIGTIAGRLSFSNNQSVYIGYNSRSNSFGSTYSNVCCLGSNAVSTASNQAIVGSSSTNSFRIYGSWSNVSDRRDKYDIVDTVYGLDFINKLRVVDYKYNYRNRYQHFNDETKEHYYETDNKQYAGKRIHTGLISQEVKEVLDSENKDHSLFQINNYSDSNTNTDDGQFIVYQETISMCVKAIQELSARVIELENKTNNL